MEQTLSEIKELMIKIQKLNDEKENLTIEDLDINQEELFDNMLDECQKKVSICGIEFSPSDILKNCDPIAYRCYKNDYMAGIDITKLSEYQDKIEELDNEIDDLKTDIKDIIDNL